MSGLTFWAMIAAMGVYQGINPPMGWLYAVGRGLERGSATSVLSGTSTFATGHYLSMLVLAIPVALALAFVHTDPMLIAPWSGIAMIAFGFYKLVRPRHPLLLARIPPTRPMSWSFVMAALHCGSPIMMLAPLASVLALFTIRSADPAIGTRLFWFTGAALLISGVMAASLFATATVIALFVHRRLGLRALTRVWINLDAGWAVIFMLMGAMALDMSSGGAM